MIFRIIRRNTLLILNYRLSNVSTIRYVCLHYLNLLLKMRSSMWFTHAVIVMSVVWEHLDPLVCLLLQGDKIAANAVSTPWPLRCRLKWHIARWGTFSVKNMPSTRARVVFGTESTSNNGVQKNLSMYTSRKKIVRIEQYFFLTPGSQKRNSNRMQKKYGFLLKVVKFTSWCGLVKFDSTWG